MTSTLVLVVSSPIEQFEVASVGSIGAVLGVTNFTVYSVISVVFAIGIHTLTDNQYRLVPSYWSVAVETLYSSVVGFTQDQLGSTNQSYVPFAYALFMLLLIANLLGNVPYSFALTASVVIAIGLSVTLWLGVTLLSVTKHGLHFFSFFVPIGTPIALVPLLVLIELVSYFARAISLGVRLFANIVAGHLLLTSLSGFLYTLFTTNILVAFVTLLPMSIFTALIGLELAVAVIQAYVFVTLTCSYITDAIDLHL